MQVADRWHLMENASAAFLDAVRKSMRSIRGSVGATTVNPGLLTCAEKLQYEGYLRHQETNAAIMGLFAQGFAIKEVVRRTGYSRNLVRQVTRGERTDVFRVRKSTLDAHLPLLDEPERDTGEAAGAVPSDRAQSQPIKLVRGEMLEYDC